MVYANVRIPAVYNTTWEVEEVVVVEVGIQEEHLGEEEASPSVCIE